MSCGLFDKNEEGAKVEKLPFENKGERMCDFLEICSRTLSIFTHIFFVPVRSHVVCFCLTARAA